MGVLKADPGVLLALDYQGRAANRLQPVGGDVPTVFAKLLHAVHVVGHQPLPVGVAVASRQGALEAARKAVGGSQLPGLLQSFFVQDCLAAYEGQGPQVVGVLSSDNQRHDSAVAEPAHVRRRQSQVLEQGHDVLRVLLVEVLEGVAVVRPAAAQEVRDNHLVVGGELVDLMAKVGAACAQRAVKEYQRRAISLHNAVQTPVLCHNIHLSGFGIGCHFAPPWLAYPAGINGTGKPQSLSRGSGTFTTRNSVEFLATINSADSVSLRFSSTWTVSGGTYRKSPASAMRDF